MKDRIYTGFMLFLIILLTILLRQFTIYAFDALILLIMVGGAFESARLFAKIGFFNDKKVVMAYPVLLYGLFLLLNHFKQSFVWSLIYNLALIALIIIFKFVLGLITKKSIDNEIKTRNFKGSKYNFILIKAVNSAITMLYPAVLLFSFILLNHLATIITLPEGLANANIVGLVAIVAVFALASLVDIFSMLFGKLIGGKKLMPSVSPNKTISGSVGGILFTMLVATALYFVLTAFASVNTLFYTINFGIWQVLLLTFLTGVFCNVGDLFESFLKRKAKVKDSGTILPGHGGLLDRFDSHSLAAVVVLVFFIILL